MIVHFGKVNIHNVDSMFDACFRGGAGGNTSILKITYTFTIDFRGKEVDIMVVDLDYFRGYNGSAPGKHLVCMPLQPFCKAPMYRFDKPNKRGSKCPNIKTRYIDSYMFNKILPAIERELGYVFGNYLAPTLEIINDTPVLSRLHIPSVSEVFGIYTSKKNNPQLYAFKTYTDYTRNCGYYWMRDVGGDYRFHYGAFNGLPATTIETDGIGVRPRFILCRPDYTKLQNMVRYYEQRII